MTLFALRRLAAALLLLWLVLSAVFLVLHLAPGDPTSLVADPRTSAADRARLRHQWGLDRPLAEQYLRWLERVALRGDWGTSLHHHRPAARVVAEALPATLLLGTAALAMQLVIAVPLGIAAARRAGSLTDQTIGCSSLVVYSIPTFWLALMALLLLAYRFPVLPPSHLTSVEAPGGWAGVVDLLRHLVLPAGVLGVSAAGGLVRFVRGGLLEVIDQEQLQAARARGLSERRVFWLHGLRNTAHPLLQSVAFSLPALLSGVLVTEVVFSWPGMGRVFYASLLGRDYPVALVATAWSAGLVVLSNLAVDLAQAVLDPRVRRG